jgi:succinate dehydrogenase / fumarate reductase iron-sulfur subunit/antitoxin CptB
MSINKQKLKWRSRRSLLELDLYFECFLQKNGLEQLTDNELWAYHELLEFEDGDLLLLFQGKERLVSHLQQTVVDKIRNLAKFKMEVI